MLRDGLVNARLSAGALLDIDAGVGALMFELLDRGVNSAVAVEASLLHCTFRIDGDADRRPTPTPGEARSREEASCPN
jgi:hypothetical protein